eukprot:scaffold6941_cov214-Pinguiococcus_pyrenoidosus.AAC.4
MLSRRSAHELRSPAMTHTKRADLSSMFFSSMSALDARRPTTQKARSEAKERRSGERELHRPLGTAGCCVVQGGVEVVRKGIHVGSARNEHLRALKIASEGSEVQRSPAVWISHVDVARSLQEGRQGSVVAEESCRPQGSPMLLMLPRQMRDGLVGGPSRVSQGRLLKPGVDRLPKLLQPVGMLHDVGAHEVILALRGDNGKAVLPPGFLRRGAAEGQLRSEAFRSPPSANTQDPHEPHASSCPRRRHRSA